jgi:type I restriction enzyme S subunit
LGIVCLDNLISDLRGGAPLESEDFRQEGFPVLHKGAIKPFGEIEIDSKKKTFTHQNFVDKHPKSIISKQHVAVILRDLIPSGASIGLMSYLKSSPYSYYILAQGAYGFLVDEKRVCPEYLVLLSNTAPYRKFIRSIAVGSTQIHVRTPIFTEIYIPLPPIAEQKRIAVIAQKCDRLRRTRRYIQQLSDGYLRSVFLEMFGNPSTNSMGWEILDLESQLKKLRAVGVQFQEKFAQIVQRFERLRIQQREGDRQAEHLFQTVLHRAFRGEL